MVTSENIGGDVGCRPNIFFKVPVKAADQGEGLKFHPLNTGVFPGHSINKMASYPQAWM